MLQSRTRVDDVNPKQFPQKNQVWAEFNGRRTTLCTSAWSGGESKEGNKLCKCRSPTDRSGFCYSTRMPKIIKSEPAETTIVCGQLWSIIFWRVFQEKIQYRPLHALHFEELEKIWESDRRIPNVPSRRAWAEARNLNPTNVHSWWYRRRPLARKLKIKIPRDEYELFVGVPPVLPEFEDAKAEISTEMDEIPSSESHDIGYDSSLLGISDTQTSSPVTYALDSPSMVKNPLFEELSAEMSAYTRSPSPIQDFSWLVPPSTSRHSTPSRDSSLPPSSPPPTSTPPPCLLTFPEDMTVEDDKIGASDRFLGISFSLETLSACLYTSRLASNRTQRNMLVDFLCASFLLWSAFSNRYIGKRQAIVRPGIFASIFDLVS